MRKLALALVLAAAATVAHAQEGGFDFNLMEFLGGDETILAADGTVTIRGNADVAFYSNEPGGKRLRIRAGTLSLVRQGEEVESMTMTGNVIVDHPSGQTIRSESGRYSIASNQLVFDGNVRIDLGAAGTLTGEKLVYDLATGETRITRMRGKDIDPQALGPVGGGGSGEAAPRIFTARDVRDWPALLTKLKAQGRAEAASPGRRMLELLGRQAQQNLMGLDTQVEPADNVKQALLSGLDRIAVRADLYTAEAWAGVAVPEEAQALIERGPSTLPQAELVRLNRLLIHAAFPDAIAPPG